MASQFARAVASAQAGYGGRGRDGSFREAHSQQHTDAMDRMDTHDRRLAALEALDPSTLHAATGEIEKPGPQNFGET
jgi:hypothetical protein